MYSKEKKKTAILYIEMLITFLEILIVFFERVRAYIQKYRFNSQLAIDTLLRDYVVDDQ